MVVAHKHAVALVDDYFCGDYPQSKAMIDTDASWVAILLQSVFFFIPNLFCSLHESTWPERVASAKPTVHGSKAMSEEEEPENWALRNEMKEKITEMSAMDDMVGDLTSFRFLYFFSVPKVKYMMHQLVFLAYMFVPMVFIIKY